MDPSHAMAYGRPTPECVSDAIWEGVYVDDHFVIGILPRDSLTSVDGPDLEIVDRSHKAYAASNLERAPEKSLRAKQSFVAWGVAVSSDPGSVGVVPPARRMEIFMLGVLGLVQGRLT